MLDYSDNLKFVISLLAIVNPIGALPIYISLTDGYRPQERARIILLTSVAVVAILLVTLLSGELILRFFGISIDSFQVGGGLLLLLMAISMLQARTSRVAHTSDEAEETADRETIAVVPLAIPLLSGPGAISAVIVYADKAKEPLAYLITSAGIFIIGLSIFLSLLAAPFIARKLGRTGINIVTRIMGLILAAIAVEFITTGLKNIFLPLA
ncbi:YchE family NAAT transporter [Desulfurivibrio dismutans]|uniref:YchE family NAAT transporter n=1 Tax=Desulfurivibrio dismutans TaxID=1398908 RepID=UPI0023DAD037|nr:YchE family NAAT transporter [Desulfurivibrio alkaliphilus]MDF1614065.1 YchE family NAAT transporter [Desulfurivibrio alkaliphilus]